MTHEIFKKTPYERKQLKLVKTKGGPRGSISRKRDTIIKMPLIIYMKYSKEISQFKSTHSFLCPQSEVDNRINFLREQGYIINKVYFNNKVYKWDK